MKAKVQIRNQENMFKSRLDQILNNMVIPEVSDTHSGKFRHCLATLQKIV